MQLHPQEALLQTARAFQQSPSFAPYRALRQVVEHRIARLAQLGIRQARYRGRTKTLFQAYIAAAVANLTRLAAMPVVDQPPNAVGPLHSGLVIAYSTPRRFVRLFHALHPVTILWTNPSSVSFVTRLKRLSLPLALDTRHMALLRPDF